MTDEQHSAELEWLRRAFPDLEILELVGRGGMGEVYRARQRRLDREVALKLISKQKASADGFGERFQREAKSLARLSHPNIVTIHDTGEVDGRYWLLMEFVQGRNLRELMLDETLSPPDALALVPQLCDALQFAHEAGVVHRDIKPENILIDVHGRARVVDFGLAKITAEEGTTSLTAVGDVMGTLHYMAPEQGEGAADVDHRADIYALGVLIYEMLTGHLPVGRFDVPSKEVRVDVRLDRIVLRALERDPARRYQHVHEVKSDIEAVPSRGTESGRSRRVALGILIAGVVAVSVFATRGWWFSAPPTIHLDQPAGYSTNAEEVAVTGRIDDLPDGAVASIGFDGTDTPVGILSTGEFSVEVRAPPLGEKHGSMIVRGRGETVAEATVIVIRVLPTIHLDHPAGISASTERVTVTGRIDDFPESGSAEIEHDGVPFPTSVTTEGEFSAEVRSLRLGKVLGSLIVRSRTGDPIATAPVIVVRTTPESVEVVVETLPSVKGASVEALTLDGENIWASRTDAEGTARGPVPYGQFNVRVSHPKYLLFRSRAVTTGFGAIREVSVSLKPLSEEGRRLARVALLEEMESHLEKAAAGDPEAIGSLGELSDQLLLSVDDPTDEVTAPVVPRAEELADAVQRLGAGDSEAHSRVVELLDDLKELVR